MTLDPAGEIAEAAAHRAVQPRTTYAEGRDTEILGRGRCPDCEPEATVDHRVDITWVLHCARHCNFKEKHRGSGDALTDAPSDFVIMQAAGGFGGAVWCALVHRRVSQMRES